MAVLVVAFVGASALSWGCAVTEPRKRPRPVVTTGEGSPITNEQYCTELTQAYCGRCGSGDSSCFSNGFGHCMGGATPADAAHLTLGPTRACAAAIGQGDCGVLQAGYYPAVCDIPGPAPEPTVSTSQPSTSTVALSAICPGMMQEMCNRCQPTHMTECVPNSLAWCYQKRSPETSSGWTQDRAKSCERAYKKLSCDAIATGYVPVECNGLRKAEQVHP